MKIAFVTNHDVNNKIARSGVPYSIYHELGRYYEMVYISPNLKDTLWHKFLYGVSLGLRGCMKLIGWNYIHNPIQAYLRSKSVQKQLKSIEYDAIFSIDGPALAFLNQKKPVFLRTDAIAPSAIDYYKFNVPMFAKKWAVDMEKKTLNHVDKFFVASEWMIDEVKKYDVADLNKCMFVPTGANLDKNDVKYVPKDYSLNKQLRMLFVGYNLKRKGLDIAYDTMKLLREQYGMNVSLTVVGGTPDVTVYNDEHLIVVGKLNKNKDDEYKRFYDEFEKANLFIFPTQAEYHGIVNCEAAAFGLPIFSYNTGGVSSYCIDGYNGRCLDEKLNATSYAQAIHEAIKTGMMKEYSQHSRELFDKKFNWSSWGEKVVPIMNEIINNTKG